MKKNERGVFETLGDRKVALCQWNDNRPVRLVSNFQIAEPTSMARRWSATKRSHVYITQPHVVNVYNKYMGEVDLLDRFLSEYRPRLRSKKWWWCLFANFLDISVVAGWRIHKFVGGTLSHLEFRRQIVRTFLGKVPDKAARRGLSRMPVDSIRLSGTLHVCSPAGKQGRCKQCKSNTRSKCQLCDVLLHHGCAEAFHANTNRKLLHVSLMNSFARLGQTLLLLYVYFFILALCFFLLYCVTVLPF